MTWGFLACAVIGCLVAVSYQFFTSVSTAELPSFPFPPDTRPQDCPANKYKFDAAKKVSVIILWHKEKWEHLRDTMAALLYFTDDSQVQEYVFISDGNADTKEKELREMSPKVVVYSFVERQGLILAKMKGAQIAKGDVLVFMEAHCIVNKDWLPPLLHELALKPKALVMPQLDIIPQGNWSQYFSTGQRSHWRYEWNMNLVATNPSATTQHSHKPYTTPGTSGGIFAINTDWFRHLKFFDPGMREWGGDHFELSHKVWRCGGLIEIAPCSRIGHLFREAEARPYPVEVDQVVNNYKRLAEVWMPDHLSYFYRMKPEAVPMKVDGIEARRKEAEELGCENMAWYLANVDHEMAWEMDKICHPFVTGPDKCKGELHFGRFTITKEDAIPRKEYMKRKAAGDKVLAARKN